MEGFVAKPVVTHVVWVAAPRKGLAKRQLRHCEDGTMNQLEQEGVRKCDVGKLCLSAVWKCHELWVGMERHVYDMWQVWYLWANDIQTWVGHGWMHRYLHEDPDKRPTLPPQLAGCRSINGFLVDAKRIGVPRVAPHNSRSVARHGQASMTLGTSDENFNLEKGALAKPTSWECHA